METIKAWWLPGVGAPEKDEQAEPGVFSGQWKYSV